MQNDNEMQNKVNFKCNELVISEKNHNDKSAEINRMLGSRDSCKPTAP